MKTVLLTRPTAQSQRFAATLGPEFQVIVSPLLEIIYTSGPSDTGAAQAVVFTSSNGVSGWVQRNGPTNLPAFCVGERTADSAIRAGFSVPAVAETLATLAPLIAAVTTAPLLHIRGTHVSGDITVLLPAHQITTCITYEARATPLSTDAHTALSTGQIDMIPVFSPRTAHRLVAERADSWQIDNTRLCAISPATADALKTFGQSRIQIAEQPNAASILAMLRCDSAQ